MHNLGVAAVHMASPRRHVVLSTQYLNKALYPDEAGKDVGFPLRLKASAEFAAFPFALALKQLLEEAGFSVYNPNTDNTRGDEHWDVSFKENLDLAKQSGGFMLSLRDEEVLHHAQDVPAMAGLQDTTVSEWQIAEAQMADERSLPVEIFENRHSVFKFIPGTREPVPLERQVDNFVSLCRSSFQKAVLSKYGLV